MGPIPRGSHISHLAFQISYLTSSYHSSRRDKFRITTNTVRSRLWLDQVWCSVWHGINVRKGIITGRTSSSCEAYQSVTTRQSHPGRSHDYCTATYPTLSHAQKFNHTESYLEWRGYKLQNKRTCSKIGKLAQIFSMEYGYRFYSGFCSWILRKEAWDTRLQAASVWMALLALQEEAWQDVSYEKWLLITTQYVGNLYLSCTFFCFTHGYYSTLLPNCLEPWSIQITDYGYKGKSHYGFSTSTATAIMMDMEMPYLSTGAPWMMPPPASLVADRTGGYGWTKLTDEQIQYVMQYWLYW